MENAKYCAVLVRRSEDVWEGIRTTLGLAAHNYWATLYVLNVEVEMTDALKENLEWLEEMECEYVSNIKQNARYNFKIRPLESISEDLAKMDLVIPFGQRH